MIFSSFYQQHSSILGLHGWIQPRLFSTQSSFHGFVLVEDGATLPLFKFVWENMDILCNLSITIEYSYPYDNWQKKLALKHGQVWIIEELNVVLSQQC